MRESDVDAWTQLDKAKAENASVLGKMRGLLAKYRSQQVLTIAVATSGSTI